MVSNYARIAFTILRANSPTAETAFSPSAAMIFTIAEPTMAPSLFAAMAAACSGLEMPNPMAMGVSVTARMRATMESRSVVMLERVPVTPNELTQ